MTIPKTMRAIRLDGHGGPEVLRPFETEVPEPGPGQVLIRLAYAGVNRPDALQRAGLYAPPPDASPLPGLEGAGEIAAIGEGVTRWSVGDAVTALLPGGGYAEYAVTDAAQALPVPGGMDMARAAALCETYFTVWSNVFMRGALSEGETFLVHGGSSGIGTTAIQLAVMNGARVIATAGSAGKCAACTDLGAARAINYREEDFVEILKSEGGADLILDMVGGDYMQRNISALAMDGRLVQIAFLQGSKAKLDMMQVMTRRLTLTGSTLRPQSNAAKAAIAGALEAEVWPHLASGRIGPVMDSEFPLEQAAAAHERLEGSTHIGKIVLKVAP
ncbi:NAD(P)H-quinone oxidoreductase [Profundibacterium mesophilum]|uniref:Quinone oxidoreductase n=1 Tax=Profundibacterium mesophilum KAUST100406-0324 TaxID=1037889 RepID=A0A921NXG7_9RHOB|nr:NAD(P)H-quinone oxidoreductase [Profundibacterium mesophilum]KAF0677200.1 Quinone oxidoreductase [Profundibacterium mesophilum KAUST100406-0324]